MRVLSRSITILIYTITAIILIASVGSAVAKKPVLLSVIRSNSMLPLTERGDMVLIWPLRTQDPRTIGDIVIFRSETGPLATRGWIFHRIMEGNDQVGYITKGDNNPLTDQAAAETGPVKREWIVAKAVTLKGKPIKIPYIGLIPLWAEGWQKNPLLLPILGVVVGIVIGANELLASKRKSRKRKQPLARPALFLLSGLTVSVIMGGLMLSSAQRINLDYQVAGGGEASAPSRSGVIRLGEPVTRTLTTLKNTTAFPLVITVSMDNPDASLVGKQSTLSKGEELKLEVTVTPRKEGSVRSAVTVGTFFPLLPPAVIHFLAGINFWMALCAIALLPGIPIIAVPFLDYRMRSDIARELRRAGRRLQAKLPI